jgi:hypothetical protein
LRLVSKVCWSECFINDALQLLVTVWLAWVNNHSRGDGLGGKVLPAYDMARQISFWYVGHQTHFVEGK